MDIVRRTYHTLFYENADPRVKDWLLMSSPWPPVAILATYLALIKIILPTYMRDRKPYKIKTAIKWYNILQILANTVVSWGIMTSGWTTTYHFGCVLPDYSTNPEPMRMLTYLWWTLIIKYLELIETVFFLLRKKEEQASFLHVYHHVISSLLMWVGVKYVGGGITSFSPMVNNMVHVIMYSYYLLSSEGSPRVKSFLGKYKRWLTIIQMIQFTVLLVYTSQIFLPNCKVPKGVAYMYFPNVIIVYYMFYQFFKKTYLNNNNNKEIPNGLKKNS